MSAAPNPPAPNRTAPKRVPARLDLLLAIPSHAIATRPDGVWMVVTGIGLATAVVPREELSAAVSDLVAALTAPLYGAVTETKALLRSAMATDLEEQRRLEREAQVRRFRELASLMG